MQYSTTQGGNLAAMAAIIVLIARQFKLDLDQADILALLTSTLGLIALVKSFVSRYKRGDLTLAGFRKPSLGSLRGSGDEWDF